MPDTAAAPAPSRPRGRQTALDMVRSLAVIGAAVAGVVLLLPRSEQPVVQPVDLDQAAVAARSQGDVPVVVPGLDDDWRVTSARREDADGQVPATWHIGWLSPEEQYVAVEATRRATPQWVRDVTSEGEQIDTLEVDDRSWAVYTSGESGRSSLLLEESDAVLVVTGSAVLDELVEVAESAGNALAASGTSSPVGAPSG